MVWTQKKSHAQMADACCLRNDRQREDGPRRWIGCIYLAIVLAETLNPSRANSAWILRWPQTRFSMVIRRIRVRSEVCRLTNHRYARIQKRRSESVRRGRGLRRCRTSSCWRRQRLSAISNSLGRMAAAKAHSKQRNIDLSRMLSDKQAADAAQCRQ